MGRKWTNFKFELDGRDNPVKEPSSNPRTQEDALQDYIRDRWADENIPHAKNVDVMFGNYSTDKIKRVADEFFKEFEFISRSAVVFVTDSAHVGYGWVFERDGQGAVCTDEYTGYEGAMGNDVAGEISDDHGIHVNPEWYWD